jgi:hypothetical protein
MESTPTSKVYIKTFSYSDTGAFAPLDDGYYKYVELSSSNFEYQKATYFQDAITNEWTEEQIKTFLLGWNFFADKAAREAKWLTSVEHGWIGLRNGSLLKIIMK